MAIDVGGRVIKGTASSDPGSAAAGDIYHNTTHNILRYYDGTAWRDILKFPNNDVGALGTYNNPGSGPQALYDAGMRENGQYYLNPDNGTPGLFYCWLSGGTTYASSHSGSYGWALSMRWNHPHFFGQLLANRWDGRPSGASGPNITDKSTWNGESTNGAGHYTPDSATHVLFGFTNDNDNVLDDWTHTTKPGSPSSNSGLHRTTMNGVNNHISTTKIQSNVSGGGDYDDWHFRPTDSTWYKPIGVSKGLNHGSNCDHTNSLLGVMNDSCSGSTQTRNGITPNFGNNSETYVGNRKNLNSGNGAGGAYCVTANSDADRGKWMMWWR